MDSKLSLILLLLFFCVVQLTNSKELYVNPTLVLSDPEAVCLTGKPASYYFSQGFDTGSDNWLVYLAGGAWCVNFLHCIKYADDRNITKDPMPYPFNYILSNDKDQNSEFFNWNKVVLNYCDGGSFTGDTEQIYNGTKLYFRGERIYNAVMQELLNKGMRMAQNALLVGSSAGGIAATLHCRSSAGGIVATLHCDRFRGLFSDAVRVKCLSDAAYFFPSRRFKDDGDKFISAFERLMELHGSMISLPKSCTSRLPPYLCFFPQNVQQDIKTPIFFLMSAFDSVELEFTFPHHANTIKTCIEFKNCSTEMIKAMRDLRLELLSVLPKQDNTSSRGILITSPSVHEQLRYPSWDFDMVMDGSNETISEMFSDWYFDGKVVQVIDKDLCPYCNCSLIQNNN